MEWKTLLSEKRMRGSGKKQNAKKSDFRSEFEKDYHRIIGSASFRRLQDKTQVFPLDQSDFVRTRLTHSLEVSSLAKSLGQNIGEAILERGADEVLNRQMVEDFYHFEGNAQALRLVTRLHYLVDEYGMNLTYALLNTIIKYPVSSTQVHPDSGNIREKKMGYFLADEKIFEEITQETKTGNCRHPLTYILEAADDLAYKTADIEDAFVKGFLSYHAFKEELVCLNEQYPDSGFDGVLKLKELYQRGQEKGVQNPEAYAIKNWIIRAQGFLIDCATKGFMNHYEEIMAGTFQRDLFHGTFGEKLMECLGNIAYRYVFSSREIYRMEVKEAVILDFLMDRMIQAVLYYDTDRELNAIDSRVLSFISDNYKKAYSYQAEGKSEAEKLYLRLLLVTDYVCGMTDSYAKRLYQDMNGII